MTNLLGSPLAEQPSSQNASFVVLTPFGAGLHQFQADEMVSPIFGPNAPFWETVVHQAISQFGTTTTMNVSAMELTPNSRRPFPYLLPSDVLGRSSNIPSSVIPTNAPSAPMVRRLTTPVRVPQSFQNPLSNSHMGGSSMNPIDFLNVGSQFHPPTSQTTRGSYVPFLHNISDPPPPVVRASGHAGLGHIGPASKPTTSSWVPPQQPNIVNQYLSGEQYINPLYVPYPGGATNQWAQPTFGTQDRTK